MLLVACKIRPKIHSAYKAWHEELPFTVDAVYDKIAGIEIPVSEALLRETANNMIEVLREIKPPTPELIPGYRLRIVDGNKIAATDRKKTVSRVGKAFFRAREANPRAREANPRDQKAFLGAQNGDFYAEPTRDGDTMLGLLTNLPPDVAAVDIANAYPKRWQIETAFQEIEALLSGEINTLGYPEAALFSLSCASVAFNVLQCLRLTLEASHPECTEKVEISLYYCPGKKNCRAAEFRIGVLSDERKRGGVLGRC